MSKSWKSSYKKHMKKTGNYLCTICGTESKCSKCGTLVGLQVHHVKTISSGGTNARSNLVLACPDCHKWVHSFKGYK